MKKEKKQIEFEKYTFKEKLLISCLTGFTVSFVLCLFGPIDIYANNMQEFAFTFKDMALPVFLLFVGVAVGVAALLMCFQRFILNIISSLPLSLIVASIIEGIINRSPKIISGDVAEASDREYYIMIITYVVCIFGFAFLSICVTEKWKNVVVFLCVLLVGMNGASLVSDFINKDLIHDNSINCDYVLSKDGLDSVSGKENIIYILFDRFDNEYVDSVKEKYPDFFDDLEGFTYFDSAVSTYTRTFPAVPFMISGNEYKAETSAFDYLASTYQNSDFLKDLKDNGYKIDIYADRYYEYNDAKAFEGIADNVSKVTSYKANKKKIVEYLFKLSIARTVKVFLTQIMYVNANYGLATKLSTLECEGEVYHDNDAWLSDYYKDTKLTADASDKTFTFIYMHGSHTPHILDENGDYSEDATDISQTIGSFKTVKLYLEYLKELGVYDNSTIIISGDHGIPITEDSPLHEETDKGVTTAIMIKPKKADNKKLIIVKDAKIKSDKNYGKSALDIKENESRTRIFYQSVFDVDHHKLGLNKYEIKGDAHDINNWNLTEEIRSDYTWY